MFEWALVIQMTTLLARICLQIYMSIILCPLSWDVDVTFVFVILSTALTIWLVAHNDISAVQASSNLTNASVKFAKIMDISIRSITEDSGVTDDVRVLASAMQTSCNLIAARPLQIQTNFFHFNSAMLTSVSRTNMLVFIKQQLDLIAAFI